MTPNTRRWLITAGAVIVLVIGGFALWPRHSEPVTGSQLGQMTADGSLIANVPSTGVEPYGATPPVDYSTQMAIDARREYTEYYQCKTYPDDAHLKPIDLVPTANVVLTLTYNKARNKYVAGGNSQLIQPAEVDSTFPANSDTKHAIPEQQFAFRFAVGVRYFGTFVYYHATSGWRWGQGGSVYNTHWNGTQRVTDYNLTLFPKDGGDQQLFVIIATNTATCKGDGAGLPTNFSWKDLADDGMLRPEFIVSNVHPQR